MGLAPCCVYRPVYRLRLLGLLQHSDVQRTGSSCTIFPVAFLDLCGRQAVCDLLPVPYLCSDPESLVRR